MAIAYIRVFGLTNSEDRAVDDGKKSIMIGKDKVPFRVYEVRIAEVHNRRLPALRDARVLHAANGVTYIEFGAAGARSYSMQGLSKVQARRLDRAHSGKEFVNDQSKTALHFVQALYQFGTITKTQLATHRKWVSHLAYQEREAEEIEIFKDTVFDFLHNHGESKLKTALSQVRKEFAAKKGDNNPHSANPVVMQETDHTTDAAK